MLKHYVVPQIEEFQPGVVFQHDGVPPHRGLMVCNFSNLTFSSRWIARSGPTSLPPRSPDITPVDFLWGYIKDKVNRRSMGGIETLQSQIIDVLATINEEMLKHTGAKLNIALTY